MGGMVATAWNNGSRGIRHRGAPTRPTLSYPPQRESTRSGDIYTPWERLRLAPASKDADFPGVPRILGWRGKPRVPGPYHRAPDS